MLKDIASVVNIILGVILSVASVMTIVSKSARSTIAKFFKKYGKSEELRVSINEIKSMLERHIVEDTEYKGKATAMADVNMEFMRTQCRNIIKSTFYKYNDTKVLPLYEKKTLMAIEELYIDKLDGNSFAKLLLDEMSNWKVDYESSHVDGDDE